MKKDYISIIIPCYNVSKYISKCIDAILEESFKKYEIILVDDKSTDDTLSIIKEYEKKYDFIKVIENKENKGAGYSRNQALKIAKYDLISFIDSDDYIESNFHEELLSSMKKEKSDISVCDIYMKYEGDFIEQDTKISAYTIDKSKFDFINNGLAASPCNKLFKKELFIDNMFPEGIMNEDVSTVLTSMIRAKSISYTPNTYYNYIQRKTSVQNKEFSFKRFDIFKALDILDERIKNYEDYDKYMEAIIYNQIITFFVFVIPREKSFCKRYKILRKFYKSSKKYKIMNNSFYYQFLETQPKLSKLFYKLLFMFNCHGLCLSADILISVLNLYKKYSNRNVIKKNIGMDDLIRCANIQKNKKSDINLSVVIPNYNYEKFMYQRLYSILNQTEKISEVIILDDCSKDNSRELIDNIYENLKEIIDIKKVYNETNSGSAFKQWEKGFSLAKGDYVWIAEADDYCDKKFLKNILKPIRMDKEVILSYSDTAFINADGNIFMKTIKNEIDIMKTGHFDNSFVNDGKEEIRNYAFLNCTIANVSSVVFKNNDYSDYFKMSGEFKQAGDWLFYINVMSNGKIAYSSKALNYYRLHGSNVTSTTKKQAHFDEIKRIHDYMRKNYKITKEHEKYIEERYLFLKKVWNLE